MRHAAEQASRDLAPQVAAAVTVERKDPADPFIFTAVLSRDAIRALRNGLTNLLDQQFEDAMKVRQDVGKAFVARST